jgi:thymidylate synthase (FAD)
MPRRSSLRVRPIAWTHFEPPDDVDWHTDASGGQALAEFAGRACYESWSKPNPATDTNETFLRHVLDVGHLSVLEHAHASFYVTGLSRSLSHELVRHRHLSFSQLSQRHVPSGAEFVEPEIIADDEQLHETFVAATRSSARAYRDLLDGLEERFAADESATLRRKQARQAARSLLPEAGETRLVVSGNYRAWRHFVAVRASEHADAAMRQLAVAFLRQLAGLAPNAFADFEITELPDGTEVASSPLAAEG